MTRSILNFRVFIGAFAVGVILLCGSLLYIFIARPASGQALAPVSAVLTVIPAPTSTPRYTPPTLTPLPPTPQSSPTPLPGVIAIGVYVQITGTEGEGLSMRSEPGLTAEALFLGYDSEAFLVTDGPRQADDHTWWRLTAPYDQARSGWAAADYLTVIQSP